MRLTGADENKNKEYIKDEKGIIAYNKNLSAVYFAAERTLLSILSVLLRVCGAVDKKVRSFKGSYKNSVETFAVQSVFKGRH